MNDIVDITKTPSKLNKLKNIVRSRKVQLGAAVVVTAVVTAVLARSELFQSADSMEELQEMALEVLAENAKA